MMMQPTVTPAPAQAQPLIERLYELYLRDVTASNEATDAPAGYAAPYLARYWHDPACVPFLLSCETQIVGFALVGTNSRLHTTYDGHTCNALFVLRHVRRQGIGAAAAHTLFESFPGAWEISSHAANTPGCTFWRATVDRFTHGRYNEVWLQTTAWRGHVQSFSS